MADNNYVEGNSQANSFVLTNPYACPSNFAKLKGIDKVDCCSYLASFNYSIASGGATTTIQPLTGNTSGDLNYYTVCVYDGMNRVCGQLDLANPTANFVIDTSSLDASTSWCLEFSGAVGGGAGDAACDLSYQKEVGSPAAGVIAGTTVPSNWTNVSFLLKLTSTDDADFTLFPADGLEIADGATVNLVDYLATDSQLNNLGSYVFTIEMKKLSTSPELSSAPTVAANVVSALTDTVSFPYALSKSFNEVANTVTIKTDVAGTNSGAITYLLANEGVVPSVSFTISIDVA